MIKWDEKPIENHRRSILTGELVVLGWWVTFGPDFCDRISTMTPDFSQLAARVNQDSYRWLLDERGIPSKVILDDLFFATLD